MDSTNWDAPLQTDEVGIERLEASVDRRITELDARWNRKRNALDAKLRRLDADYKNLRGELRTEVSDRRYERATTGPV